MVRALGVVIAAAGRGTRMNLPVNKQYIKLAGKPVIMYSLELFTRLEKVTRIVVVAHPEEVGYCRSLVPADRRITIVPGGKERQDSVYAGLRQLDSDTELVAVHDGARPLLRAEMVYELVRAASQQGAAIPGVPVKDTLKEVDGNGLVVSTCKRDRLYSIQTPQVFDYRRLMEAYRRAVAEKFYGTDDASLFEHYCGPVVVVPGDYRNIKITTPEDLIIAEAFLRSERRDPFANRHWL